MTAVLACVAGLSLVSGASGKRPASTPATVKVVVCENGPKPSDRDAEFRGSMARVPETARMWIRFDLQVRQPDGSFETVKAPGLSVWRKSKPGVARFAHRQRVLALERGPAYRSIVRFRWYDESGDVIKRSTKRTGLCRQPGPLPDLQIGKVLAKPIAGDPSHLRYVIRIVNDGRAASAPTNVRLTVDGTATTKSFAALRRNDVRKLSIVGSLCSETLLVEIDPDATMYEVSKDDDSRTLRCPLS